MTFEPPTAQGATARPGSERASSNRTKRWASAVVLVAAVVVLFFVLRVQRSSATYIPEIEDLVRAVGTNRPIEPRITGGFAHGAAPPVNRGARTSAESELAALTASAKIMERAKADTPAALAALGVVQLVTDDPRAAETLEAVSQRAPNDPRVKSDLAAAYLVAGRRREDARLLARALEAAEQAVALTPQSPEPLFNRALALEALTLTDQARLAWTRYLEVDASSAWADEAGRRRAALVTSNRAENDRRKRDMMDGAAHAAGRANADVVARSTFQARELIEGEILEAWAGATLRADRDAAQRHLRQGLSLADALQSATSDRFAHDLLTYAGSSSNPRADAEAALAYVRSRRELDEYRTAQAETSLARADALLAGRQNPLRLVIRFHKTLPAYYRRDYRGAAAELQLLEKQAKTRRYVALLGQIQWRRGLINLVESRYGESLSAYRAALSSLEQAREVDHIASVENALAEALRYVGDLDQSWRYQRRALRTIGLTWNPRRRHAVLLTTARTCLRDGLPRAALAVQDELVANAVSWGEPAALTSAYVQRARSLSSLGLDDAVQRQLSAARESLKRIADPTFAAQYETELLLAEGEATVRSRPLDAVRTLQRIDQRLSGSGAVLRRSQVLLAQGRASRIGSDMEGAEAAWEQGIRIFETRHATLPDELRISYFDEAWQLFDEMVALLIERNRPNEALAYLERARARTLLQSLGMDRPATPSTMEALRAQLPAHTSLLYYAVLPDRTCMWLVTRHTTRFTQLSRSRVEVEDFTRRARAEMQQSKTSTRARADLYDLILRPMLAHVPPDDVIAIVPDGVLHGVSFGALIDRVTGQPLISRHPVIKTLSGTLFANSAAPSRIRTDRLLAVGDPHFDRVEYPSLPNLPGAASEAREIAGFYPKSTVLTAADATRTAVVSALAGAGTLHFAGHALANVEFPWLSQLVLSASTQGSALFAFEVAQLPLRTVDLVVLAACTTTGGTLSRSEGAISLARPFLAAGVPTVIGTLWDVADSPSKPLWLEFHRRVTAGASPAVALQQAQLWMARSPDPVLRQPSVWAAFEAIGTAQSFQFAEEHR